MPIDLSNLPELSRDGSAYITRTYDKAGRCIAAHVQDSGLWRRVRRSGSPDALRALEGLFQGAVA